MSSARGANTTKGGLVLLGGSTGLAGGAPPAHGKVWISNIPAPRWHCTLPTDTRTLLHVPGHSPAHGSPRSWTPVWLCQVTQGDVTRARGGICLREAVQMGRPLDLASHLPETAWHGGLDPGLLTVYFSTLILYFFSLIHFLSVTFMLLKLLETVTKRAPNLLLHGNQTVLK